MNALVTIPSCPSAPRTSRALQGPGRRCTNAARRAHPCKSASASVTVSNRTTTRLSHHAQRHSIVDTSKTKRKIEQKGRLNVQASFFQKSTSVISQNVRRRIFLHCGAAGARTRQPENSKTCTFQGPSASNTTKRGKNNKKKKTVAGEGKKKREILGPFGPPTLRPPHPWGGTTNRGPTLRGWPPPFGAPP